MNLWKNLEDLGLVPGPVQFSNLLQLLSNLLLYVKISVFHFLEKVNKGQLKMVNVND